MFNTFAATYSSAVSNNSANTGPLSVIVLGLALLIFPFVIFSIVAAWKVFVKAGREGWKSIIPLYSSWVYAEIAGKPGWWGLATLLGFVPVIGGVIAMVVVVILSFELAKSFGKDPVFGLLIAFLPPVGLGILAFGSAEYTDPQEQKTVPPTAPQDSL